MDVTQKASTLLYPRLGERRESVTVLSTRPCRWGEVKIAPKEKIGGARKVRGENRESSWYEMC
jgi:hypothetical protein